MSSKKESALIVKQDHRYRDSIFGLLESYQLATGEHSPLSDMAKDVLKGFFSGEIERAEGLLKVSDNLDAKVKETEMFKNVKIMNAKEFREKGYLKELNKQFLNPLKMALHTTIDDSGNESFGGVFDGLENGEEFVINNAIDHHYFE